MQEKNKVKRVRLRNTTRMAVVFVAVMLCLQFSFSAVYLVQNHQKSAEMRETTIQSFQSYVREYYERADRLIAELQSSSSVAELSHRSAISQRNIEKVNVLVTELKNLSAANRDFYADVFVYFLASDMLYSQSGLCDRTDSSDARYARLDLDALLSREVGFFNLGGQTVTTAKGTYGARLVGVRGSRELIVLTCPDERITALSDAALTLTGAQAAFFDSSGERLAASERLSSLTPEEAERLPGRGMDGLKGFSFSIQRQENGTLVIGFSKNLPNEILLRNNLMIISVNVLCLLAIAFFAVYYNRQMVQPIQQVVAQTQYGAEGSSFSEFQSIAQWMEKTHREAEQISEKYRLTRQKSTLSDLAMGIVGETDAFPEMQGTYVVLSIVCEDSDGRDDEAQFAALLRALSQEWNARLFYRQGRQQMVLVLLEEQPLSALTDFLVECDPGSGAQIAVSRPHETLTELHCSIEEACSALMLQPATFFSGESYRILLYQDHQDSVMFQGAGPTLDAAILYCLENGNVEGCRALLQPLYERNQFSSVIAQQTLCLHLENLLQKRSRSEPRARQQRLLSIRNSFRLSNMWRVVEALLEEMTVEEDDEPSEMEASRQMDQYIRENFADPELSLQSVATHMGWSYSYTSRFFKQVNGGSFTAYVTNLRIEEAKRLLAQPELPVSEILPMVGFSVFSSFSRSFKKATGFSPSEYRAQLAGEAPTPADNAGDE